MAGNVLIEKPDLGEQIYSVDQIRQLVEFTNICSSEALLEVIVLSEGVGFVRSSNGGKYYGITSKGCGCPDYYFRQSKKPDGKCKHIKLFERAARIRARNLERAEQRKSPALEDLRDIGPFRPTLEAAEAV